MNAMTTAALAGVDIRVMMPAQKDHFLVFWGGRGNVENLLRAGVKVYQYSKGFIHTKTLLADDDISTVLIAGGYRNGDFVDYTDRNMSMMYNLSAGGGAILLKKNLGRNLLLGSHIMSDGSLARTAGVEIGGTAKPITPFNMDEATRSLRLFEPEKMKNRLNEVSASNWLNCIGQSLKKSGLTQEDLGYLAILHIKRSAHLGMLSDLGLREDQSIYLEDYGHIGQIDQILSLHLALGEGKVKDGTVVCMLAAGIGYVWAANIIKWGPAL